MATGAALQPNALIMIGKIIGVKLLQPESAGSDLKSVLELHNKQEDFDAIVDFIARTGRKNISSFLYKARKEVERVCSKLPGYQALDAAALKTETQQIRESCSDLYVHRAQYLTAENSGQRFISFDITNANFAALKACGVRHDRWEDFFRFIMPTDIRHDDPTVAHDIPDVIYRSKFIRVFVLSNLKKLQAWWEFKAAKMLRRICQAYVTIAALLLLC
jgi:hypothetical protein